MLENLRIVLVRPIQGGNVGSVCRAMKNMGLSRLVLVGPPDDLESDELWKMAVSARPIYEACERFDTLEEAVADCSLVAGTSARRGFYRDQARTPRECAPALLEALAAGPAALVFGPEDKGLSNEELMLSTHILHIPVAPGLESLNLAQAVLICAYELFVASEAYEPPEEHSPEATIEFRERMFEAWGRTMLDTGFCKEDKLEHMMFGLRRILTRGKLTESDVKILLGLARQAQWAAKHATGEQED